MKTLFTAIGALAIAATPLVGHAETRAQLAANKALVERFVHEVFDAQDVSKAKLFMAEGYIQHNPMVPTGLKGFEQAFGARWKPKAAADIKLTKFAAVVAEGDLVSVVMHVDMPDPTAPGKTYDAFWFDLYRVKSGKLVEHWDAALKRPPAPPMAAAPAAPAAAPAAPPAAAPATK